MVSAQTLLPPVSNVGPLVPPKDSVKASYLLPSNESERDRLTTVSHSIIKRAFGGILSPLIPVRSYDRILDCGCGTGVWELDLATQVPPTVDIHGIDLTSRLFPSPESMPPNVSFSIRDLTFLPLEWSNTFDIVNQRLMVAALPGFQWPVALSELYRVLKPGGWLHLVDIDPRLEPPGPATNRAVSINRALFERNGLLWDCMDKLPKMIEDAGFQSLSIDVKEPLIGRWAADQGGEDALRSYVTYFRNLKDRAFDAGIETSLEEFDRTMDNVIVEFQSLTKKTVKGHTWHLFVAQKPTSADM